MLATVVVLSLTPLEDDLAARLPPLSTDPRRVRPGASASGFANASGSAVSSNTSSAAVDKEGCCAAVCCGLKSTQT